MSQKVSKRLKKLSQNNTHYEAMKKVWKEMNHIQRGLLKLKVNK